MFSDLIETIVTGCNSAFTFRIVQQILTILQNRNSFQLIKRIVYLHNKILMYIIMSLNTQHFILYFI